MKYDSKVSITPFMVSRIHILIEDCTSHLITEHPVYQEINGPDTIGGK